MTDRNFFLNLFAVTVNEMNSVIAAAMGSGAGYADLYFESSAMTDFTLRDGHVTAGGFNIDYGTGIRVLKGERTGYSFH